MHIIDKDQVTYAILCRRSRDGAPGFFTPADAAFQAGIVERPAGHVFKAHAHLPLSAPVTRVSEFLYIETGSVELEVFDEEWRALAREVLQAGDCVVLLRGGHAIRVIDSARIVEVKQGPYPEGGEAKVYRPPA